MNGSYVLLSDTRFLYDGWNLIAEMEAVPQNSMNPSLQITRSYAWGLDVSGTAQGAGGVGGLLVVQEHGAVSAAGASPHLRVWGVQRTLAPCYDGNGNIMAYVDCSSGQAAARFEYDPFGRTVLREETLTHIQTSGQAIPQSSPPFRFSTKFTDDETALVYYGYRYYSPELGRWMNRDPTGEGGGINLCAMLSNNALNQTDFLGYQANPYVGYPTQSPQNKFPPDPADDASDDAINDFFNGSPDVNRHYGPGHPWTEEMKKHEHMDTIRKDVSGKIKTYCDGSTPEVIGETVSRPFSLNEQSVLANARIYLNDILAGLNLTRSIHSTGSVAFQYTIMTIDCNKCTARVAMDAKDTLSIGSVTRIPMTNSSLIDALATFAMAEGGAFNGPNPQPIPLDGNPHKYDNPVPNSPGNNINLHWYWYETVDSNH